MRYYDIALETARHRALIDLSENIRDVWSGLPKEWRIDKEFVLKVLELASISKADTLGDGTGEEKDANEDNDDDDDDDEDYDSEYSMDDTYKKLNSFVDSKNHINTYCFEYSSDDEESVAESSDESSATTMTLPSQSEFERRFPRSLRFDRDVVLAWTKRPDFPLLFRTRHLFLPPCLNRDKEVCLAYCRQIPRSLQDCHMDLCDDEHLVTTAVECCGGFEFQYASPRLRCEESVIRKACESDGTALLFCPRISDAFFRITRDRDFVYHVVLRAGRNEEFCTRNHSDGNRTITDGARSTRALLSSRLLGSVWKLLPPKLKRSDRELALAALRNGLRFREIPKHFVDLTFLRRALTNNCFPLYLELSEKWQSHPRLAMDAFLAEDSTPSVHARAFALLQRCEEEWYTEDNDTKCSCAVQVGDEEHSKDSMDPSLFPLRDNRDLVLVVCKRGNKKLLHELLGKPLGYPDWAFHRGFNDIPNRRIGLGITDIDDRHGRLESDAQSQGRFVLDTRPLFRIVRRPSQLLDDFEAMKLAVICDPNLYDNLSRRLRWNLDIILASISDAYSAWCRLRTVPWSIQFNRPEITLKCLKHTEKSSVLRFMGKSIIPTHVWTSIHSRELRITWIRKRGVLLNWFSPTLYSYEEMALEMAKHNHRYFHQVSAKLLNDKQFVLKALELNGQCVEDIPPFLLLDFDIVTTAAANYYNWIDRANANAFARRMGDKQGIKPMGEIFERFCDLGEFERKIHNRLELNEMFVSCFLRGIAIASKGSNLNMLDRGLETSEVFKKLVAEYLAVPFGKELNRLRKVLVNIERPESEWTRQHEPQIRRKTYLYDAIPYSLDSTRTPMRRRFAPQIPTADRRVVRRRVQLDLATNFMAEDLRRSRAGEHVEDL